MFPLSAELCDRLEAQAAASQLPTPDSARSQQREILESAAAARRKKMTTSLSKGSRRPSPSQTMPPESSKKTPKVVCPKLKAQTSFFSQDWVQDLMGEGQSAEDSPALFDDGYSLLLSRALLLLSCQLLRKPRIRAKTAPLA